MVDGPEDEAPPAPAEGEAAAAPAEAKPMFRVYQGKTRDWIPGDVTDALNQVTPQALLRDLHRPVPSFAISGYERIELGIDPAGIRSLAPARLPMRVDYRVPIESLLDTRKIVREETTERVRVMKSDWTQVPKIGYEPVSSERPVFLGNIEDDFGR